MARDCNCLFIHDILRFLLRRGKLVISVTIRKFPPKDDAQFIYPRLPWNSFTTTKSGGAFRVDGTAHESDDYNNDRV